MCRNPRLAFEPLNYKQLLFGNPAVDGKTRELILEVWKSLPMLVILECLDKCRSRLGRAAAFFKKGKNVDPTARLLNTCRNFEPNPLRFLQNVDPMLHVVFDFHIR